MKIKTVKMDYEDVLKLPRAKRVEPKRPNLFFRTLMKAAAYSDISAVKFSYNEIGMENLNKNEPCLYLMNHSSFIDLKIAAWALYPRPFNIVCTSDGFVGKKWLMRNLGCIPTKKFVSEPSLIKNIKYCLDNLGDSVLMYPEASYSFDGTATPLPDSLGKLIKHLKVPVVMIKTYGAFARDPLYNNLRLRNVSVSADIKYLLSPEDTENKSSDELNDILKSEFTFDNFYWQKNNNISINEDFRAEGLNRVLYKCPNCGSENNMVGEHINLTCKSCGKVYVLEPCGTMKAKNGDTEFPHIPDWYAWERECVKKELNHGTFLINCEVNVYVMIDYKKMYNVGSGVLIQTDSGFHLVACDGKIDYIQKPLSSYSLYADYNWYEVGDVICIGCGSELYYCFPKQSGDVVSKSRIATEELYKLKKKQLKSTL